MARNNIEVVTGWTNEPHLDIYEASALFRSLVGGESHHIIVTEENDQLAPTVRADNGITISSGGCYVQGAYMRLPIGQTYICGTTGEATDADILDSSKSEAIIYANYQQTEQGDELFFRIYPGNYTEFKNDFPTARLEDNAQNISIALWAISYSYVSNQARIDDCTYTLESAPAHALITLKNAIKQNQETIATHTSQIASLTTTLNSLKTQCNKYYKRQLAGFANFTPAKINEYQDVKINFTANYFTKKPVVECKPTTGVPHNVFVGIKECTKDYVIFRVKRTDAKTTTGLNWTATQP